MHKVLQACANKNQAQNTAYKTDYPAYAIKSGIISLFAGLHIKSRQKNYEYITVREL